jgi:hypothetical protein
LKPNTAIQNDGLYEKLPHPVLWQVNAQGMRSDHPVDRQSERYRIMIYGDSEVFGISVPIEDTIASQMEALDSRVEALNLGVFGYNAAQVAEHVERTAPLYHPDMVVYVVNENDTYDAIKPAPIVALSKVLQLIYFGYRVFYVEPEQRLLRYAPERLAALNRELGRVAAWCAQHDVPVLFALFSHLTSCPSSIVGESASMWTFVAIALPPATGTAPCRTPRSPAPSTASPSSPAASHTASGCPPA